MHNEKPTVLIVDDDPGIADTLEAILKGECEAIKAGTGAEALAVLKERHVRIILLDLRLPDCHGLEILKTVKERSPDVEVVVITAVRELETGIKALKLGAYDYLTKSFDYDEVRAMVRRILDKQASERERAYLRSEMEQRIDADFVLGKSSAMQLVDRLVRKVARLHTTLLIQGETGTGKEVLARHIHRSSHLAHKPLVTLDLSTVPENLVESTLFGHEKGAFTGAHAQRFGKFEMADGGTLFLDEIGCLRIDLQSKLLRAIQEGEVERVGGGKPIRVNVRLIVATHLFLEEAVRKGTFREDLFYRINVVPIHLPPLRDRALDIPDLARHFMGKYNRLFKKEVVKITDSAMQILMQHAWPGNIRELENLIERLIAISDDDVISQEDVPVEYYILNPKAGSYSRDPSKSLLQAACDTFERNFILKILERERWSRKRTAEVLGVPLSTLKFKCNRLQINEILSERSFPGSRRGRPRIPEEEGANILT